MDAILNAALWLVIGILFAAGVFVVSYLASRLALRDDREEQEGGMRR